jgi:hypothetical protein
MRTNILAAALALPDRELLACIGAIAGREREATAELVAHLAALEMRPSVYAAQGYGSLFDYCVGALGLSEDAACNRIEAARASTSFPVILEMLAAGSLTLTSVRKLRSHLTSENHETVLRRAAHRTKEQIEALIAELAPRPDVPASVRKLPVAKTPLSLPETCGPGLLDPSADAAAALTPRPADRSEAGPCEAQAVPPPAESRIPRPIVQALAPERYRVQFTIGQATHERLRRVQALLRRQIPDGDPAVIFDRALRLLEEAEKKKRGFGAKPRRPAAEGDRNYENRIRSGTDKPRSEVRNEIHGREASGGGDGDGASVDPSLTRRAGPSRHIPAQVKRAVWWRDRGQCAFVSDTGRRCAERSFLELHHIQPHAMDGPPTVGNISLRCRRHNQYEAEIVFGTRATASRGWTAKTT